MIGSFLMFCNSLFFDFMNQYTSDFFKKSFYHSNFKCGNSYQFYSLYIRKKKFMFLFSIYFQIWNETHLLLIFCKKELETKIREI